MEILASPVYFLWLMLVIALASMAVAVFKYTIKPNRKRKTKRCAYFRAETSTDLLLKGQYYFKGPVDAHVLKGEIVEKLNAQGFHIEYVDIRFFVLDCDFTYPKPGEPRITFTKEPIVPFNF